MTLYKTSNIRLMYFLLPKPFLSSGLFCSYKLHESHYQFTACILVDSATVICWTSPFVILGVSDLFYSFYSIFIKENSCQQTM